MAVQTAGGLPHSYRCDGRSLVVRSTTIASKTSAGFHPMIIASLVTHPPAITRVNEAPCIVDGHGVGRTALVLGDSLDRAITGVGKDT